MLAPVVIVKLRSIENMGSFVLQSFSLQFLHDSQINSSTAAGYIPRTKYDQCHAFDNAWKGFCPKGQHASQQGYHGQYSLGHDDVDFFGAVYAGPGAIAGISRLDLQSRGMLCHADRLLCWK